MNVSKVRFEDIYMEWLDMPGLGSREKDASHLFDYLNAHAAMFSDNPTRAERIEKLAGKLAVATAGSADGSTIHVGPGEDVEAKLHENRLAMATNFVKFAAAIIDSAEREGK